jgi:hypothetical protein
MPSQLNKLIFTAADYKVLLIIPGVSSFILLTAEGYGMENAREEEMIYAIGQEEPIGNKRNAAKYSGKLSMQMGELNAILLASGLVEATQIAGVTLAISALQGGFNRVYSNVNINSESLDVKAKDKQTVVSMAWTATGISNG